MGSSSDWPIMSRAVEILEHFAIPHETQVLSAHRMPDELFAYAETASARGIRTIIAGAGGAAPAVHGARGLLLAAARPPLDGGSGRERGRLGPA